MAYTYDMTATPTLEDVQADYAAIAAAKKQVTAATEKFRTTLRALLDASDAAAGDTYITDIAASLGVSRPTLYAHLKTEEQRVAARAAKADHERTIRAKARTAPTVTDVSQDSIAHQDSAGASGAPLGVFADGEFVEAVPAADHSGEIARRQVADRLGQPVEILVTCPQHPTTAAVDCLICVPQD